MFRYVSSRCFPTMFPFVWFTTVFLISRRFDSGSLSFQFLVNHDSCCFFIFGSGFVCPDVSHFSFRCFDCQQIASQDCKKTAARFTNNAGRRRKAFGFHRRAIPQGKRKREKTRLLKKAQKIQCSLPSYPPR
jgi:hypothetical protein